MAETQDVLVFDSDRHGSASLDDKGREVNKTLPTHEIMHSELSSADLQLEKIKAMIRNEYSNVAEMHNKETWDEANDFECEDPFDNPDFNEETKYMREEYLSPSQPEESGSPPPPPVSAGVGGNPDIDTTSPVVGSSPKGEAGATQDPVDA